MLELGRKFTPRELIAQAPQLIEWLRAYRVSADPSHPVHPEICDCAADTLEKFLELAEVMKAGRYAFSNLNKNGATILDFMDHWLDQERDENAKLRAQLEDKKGHE